MSLKKASRLTPNVQTREAILGKSPTRLLVLPSLQSSILFMLEIKKYFSPSVMDVEEEFTPLANEVDHGSDQYKSLIDDNIF